MGIFTAILGFFIAWFSKPKKQLAASPLIRPVGGKNNVEYEVAENFTIHNFTVKKGDKTDGGSIPLALCGLLGAHPFSPDIIAQCIGHDVQYGNIIEFYAEARKVKNKHAKRAAMEAFREADNWFYDALRINNRRVRCKLFFWAVRLYSVVNFGFWRWYIRPLSRDF